MLPLPKLTVNMFKRFLSIVLTLTWVAAFGQEASYRATWYVDGAKQKYDNRAHVTLESLDPGTSVVYATNGVELILTRMRLNKTSGSISDDERRLTGNNSAILANAGSKITIEFCDVTSHTAQADGITATGEGTLIKVQDGTVTSNRAGSAAVNASYGGKVTVNDAVVKTYAQQSPSFHTIKGGCVEVSEIIGENAGQASPLFHSAGTIRATKCRMSSAKWAIGNVEDGMLFLDKNELKSGGKCGFLLYSTKDNDVQSMLDLVNNSISVAEGPVFLVTNNNNASITLQGNNISCKSNELLEVKSDDWGEKGSNGGHATLWVNKQSLQGDIFVDSISYLDVNLNKGAKLNGQINNKENRCAQVHVKVKAGSSWTSKGESYLTSIEFDQPLAKGLKQLKGRHVIYYDPADPANAALEGKEHKTGGGVLRPMK